MALLKSTPVAFLLGTSGSTSGLYGLATSATVGSQSNQVTTGTSSNITDITVNLDIALPSVTTGSASTKVDIYVWGTNDDSGFPGGTVTNEIITGAFGACTISTIGTNALKWLGSVVQNLNTTAQTVRFDASIVTSLGYVPRRWGLVFINNTGVALPTTGHVAEYVEVYYT